MDLVHRLLSLPPAAQPGLNDLLRQLADAFGATAAGLAPLPETPPALRVGAMSAGPLPWDGDPALPVRVRESNTAIVLPRQPLGSVLATVATHADGPDFLLWIEDEHRTDWTPAEAAALTLFARAFALPAATDEIPAWAELRERRLRQHRLEQVARVVRKMAHDFGNALTSILGFTELCLHQRMPPGSTLHDYLGEVHRGAKSAAEWTRLLRLFSLRDPNVSRPGSVADAIRAEEMGLRAVWKSGAELTLDLADDLPPVVPDVDGVRQVVHNLLANAGEALPDGKGVVTLTARRLDLSAADCLAYYGRPRPGPHVAVCVRDTGAGLKPDVLRRLFAEPFFTTKPRHRGLGLAVAYGIAIANHGGLRLDNDPTGGAVAEVVFPVARARPVPVAPPIAPTRGPAVVEAVAPSGGEKVLVVDDDPHVRLFVETTLKRAGYRVEAVASAEEALATYQADQRDPFRLVLSDLSMPRTTGAELARRLLQRDSNARLLFMSGREGLDLRTKDAVLDSFELIQKPFRSERLLRAVRSAIDQQRESGIGNRESGIGNREMQ